MNKSQKNEIILSLKEKFSNYNNFYITDTESLTVENISELRKVCFEKKIEIKVAKNTLIKKALEGLDGEKFNDVFQSLHQVTALMFCENPKTPAEVLKKFRIKTNLKKPHLKAAFINGDVFIGDNNLDSLTKIKTKNELIGDIIGLLQSPAQRVIGGLINYHEKKEENSTQTINN